MRSLILIALAACSSPSPKAQPPAAPVPVAAQPTPVAAPPAPPPTPRNLVCEAFKGVNDKATCSPTFTDVGELHIHAATITLGGQQLACRTDLSMLGVLCSDPIVIKQQPAPPVEDKKPPAKATKK